MSSRAPKGPEAGPPRSRASVPPRSQAQAPGTIPPGSPEGGAREGAKKELTVRDLATNVVAAIFRLVKLSTLHSIDNQAIVRQIDDTVSSVAEYGQRTEHNVSILFARSSVFVGGQLLRANRGIYEGALELGEILSRVGASEIGIRREAKANDFTALASILAEALRKPKPPRVDRVSANIRLSGMNAAAMMREDAAPEHVEPSVQVARTYASAVVIMRRFYEGLLRGKYELPQRVKRVAQRLVEISAGETPAFLGVTSARNQNHDDAGRAVNTAVLALAMMRQVTGDPVQLSRLAMAALLYDCARARIAGAALGGLIPHFTEQQEKEAAAGTAVVLTALGGINEASVMRAVVCYEAHHERRRARFGPAYGGLRAASLHARIVNVARAFNDLLTPAPGQVPSNADDAIAQLEREANDTADRTVIRLLIGALGIFTTGTIVKLSTGEVGIVVQTPAHPSLYCQPRVRLVLDAQGGWLRTPAEIDLAHQRARPGEARYIKEIVATSDDPAGAQMRSYAASSGIRVDAGANPPSGQSGPRSQPRSYQGNPPSFPGSPLSFQGNPPSAPGNPPSYQVNPPSYQLTPPSLRQAGPPSQAPQRSHARAGEPSVLEQPLRPGRTTTLETPVYGAAPARAQAVEPSGLEPDDQSLLEPIDDDEVDATRAVSFDERAQILAAAGERGAKRATTAAPELAAGSRPPPTADGSLQRTPFVHLLIYMLDQRLTGTAVFTLPDGVEHAIYFDDGTPAKVRTGTMLQPLDRVLLDEGMLDEATLRGTLTEVSRKNILHGRLLVMKGLLDRQRVLHALRVQVLRKVTQLFELPATTRYAYYEDENLLASYGGPELTPTEPLAVIMAGARLMAGEPLVDATLRKIAGRPLALHIDAETRRMQLTRNEQAVVDLVRASHMTLEQLLQGGVAPERVVRLVVYALVVTRQLDLGAGKPPVGFGRPPVIEDAGLEPPAPRPTTPAPAEATHEAMDSAADSARTPTSFATRAPEPSPAPPVAEPPPSSRQAPPPATPRRAMPPPVPSSRTPRSAVQTPPADAALAGPPSSPATPTSPAPPPASSRAEPRAPIEVAFAQGSSEPAEVPAPPPPSVSAPEPGAVARPPAAPARRAAPPPRPAHIVAQQAAPASPTGGAPAAPNGRRAEIEARAHAIDGEDFFQVLGVAEDATPEQIKSAYFALAKSWHPDRLPHELLEVKSMVARVFARLSEAYQTLSDPAKAKEYVRLQKAGGTSADDQEKVARVVDAAFEFQKAEILLKKNDLAGAEQLAAHAVQADPEQPEYVALLVWVRALRRGDPPDIREGQTSAHFDDLLKMLDSILKKEPRFERALYYRGVLLKRSGRSEQSIRDFRLASEVNPKNLDAVREVRLYEMRKRGGAAPSTAKEKPPEGQDGLFGKLFKR